MKKSLKLLLLIGGLSLLLVACNIFGNDDDDDTTTADTVWDQNGTWNQTNSPSSSDKMIISNGTDVHYYSTRYPSNTNKLNIKFVTRTSFNKEEGYSKVSQNDTSANPKVVVLTYIKFRKKTVEDPDEVWAEEAWTTADNKDTFYYKNENDTLYLSSSSSSWENADKFKKE